MHSVPTLDWDAALLRLAIAAVLGGLVGIEREIREREAGLRTHMLVSVGSALFTIVSAYGFHSFLASGQPVIRADPTRIAAQIVTGIGFLGAGAIIRQGFSVRGLTTAATLWIVAAIGMAAGAGYYSVAWVSTAIVLFSLWPLRLIAHRWLSRLHPESGRLHVVIKAGTSAAAVLAALEEHGCQVESFDVMEGDGRRELAIDADFKQEHRVGIVSKLGRLDGVVGVRWGR